MSVHLFVCVDVDAYSTHTYVYIRLHTYVCTYVYVYIHTYICIYVVKCPHHNMHTYCAVSMPQLRTYVDLVR